MLAHLAISDFVIVRSMEIEFSPGFCALTGETGVGKSIVLAALGMVLGARTERSALRPGAEHAEINALFEIHKNHPIREQLEQHALSLPPGDPLILRRQIQRMGASRAFINDRPVSSAFLRQIGSSLVELHGQRAGLSLLEPAGQLSMLDAWAKTSRAACTNAWEQWKKNRQILQTLQEKYSENEAENNFLTSALQELETLDPQAGEASKLAGERTQMQQLEQTGQSLNEAAQLLEPPQDDGPASRLSAAANALYKVGDASPALNNAQAALDRALAETEEAIRAIAAAQADMDSSPDRLEQVETRLFDLRALARKHSVNADTLPELHESLAAKLALIEKNQTQRENAETNTANSARKYEETANSLSKERKQAGKTLAKAVQNEIIPLRLDKMRFRVNIQTDKQFSGANGQDKLLFEIAPQTEAAFAPLARIASGGEFSRLALALRVCLAGPDSASSLVFDEADAGIGGATAAAVGERLAKLGKQRQIISVTHSPQVAACANSQWRITRSTDGKTPLVTRLDAKARQEEIARMLAGSSVTDEARSAARRLLAGTGQTSG